MTIDSDYLVWALRQGGCNVGDYQAYTSLVNCGYMVPALIPQSYGYGWMPQGMALTKKGHKRALQIVAMRKEKRKEWEATIERRGIRGAAWPKRYRDPHRSLYGAGTWPKKLKYPMGVNLQK